MTPKLQRFICNHLKLTDCECLRAENSSEPSGCQWWPNAVWRQLSIYPLSNRRRLYKSLPGRNARDAGIRKGKCNADGFSIPFLNHCLVSFFSNFNGFYRSRFVSKTFLSVNKDLSLSCHSFVSQLISTGGQCSPKKLREKWILHAFCFLECVVVQSWKYRCMHNIQNSSKQTHWAQFDKCACCVVYNYFQKCVDKRC